MNHFRCRCGNVLFFENTVCVQCKSEVGYDSATNTMVALDANGPMVRCQNGQQHQVCNWVIPKGAANPLCPSCRLNRTIPDLSIPGNQEKWHLMETAKRRALHTLLRFGLFPVSKNERPDGLAFDFLMPTPEAPVLSGHEEGVITLNILEADDPHRETERQKLGEPYRTLVGHFRHELGHYFWDQFFRTLPENSVTLSELRQVFGDDRLDYGVALKKHYAEGAPANWSESYVSAYATSHPWEDWAETWAHYLHLQEGLETARSFGWNSESVSIPFTPFTLESIADAAVKPNPAFLKILNDWAKLSPAINELAASLGHPNLYPFVYSTANVRKHCFVDRMVMAARGTNAASQNSPNGGPIQNSNPQNVPSSNAPVERESMTRNALQAA